jgi:hypothetical protein
MNNDNTLSNTIANLDEHRQYKELLERLKPTAIKLLSQLHQSEEAYLGARAIEILSEG